MLFVWDKNGKNREKQSEGPGEDSWKGMGSRPTNSGAKDNRFWCDISREIRSKDRGKVNVQESRKDQNLHRPKRNK